MVSQGGTATGDVQQYGPIIFAFSCRLKLQVDRTRVYLARTF